MDPATQKPWDEWCDARIANAIAEDRKKLFETLSETDEIIIKRTADALDKIRDDIKALEDRPPLFSAPDKKLATAMTRVGDEMHEQREAIEALRAATGKNAEKTDVAVLRRQLDRKISELETRNEVLQKNLRDTHTMIFGLRNLLDHLHGLVARLARSLDADDALLPVDRMHLPEERKSADVLNIADLRSVG
jgi:predicted RNase H-like nuclease (RuvC/YqgF family)